MMESTVIYDVVYSCTMLILISVCLFVCFCLAPGKQLSSTQYLHTVNFIGKDDIQNAKTIDNVPKMECLLNVLFDTGAYHNIVDETIANNTFKVLPGPGGTPTVVSGLLVHDDKIAYAIGVLNGKKLGLTMHMAPLNSLIIQGVKIDVLIGSPTMCEWGVIIDTANGHIPIKVIEPVVLDYSNVPPSKG